MQLDSHGTALCPFHADQKGKSLKVYSDPARGWHCFGCGAGGTVIDFAMRWWGITFRQAVARLDCEFGLQLPLRPLTLRERRIANEKAAQIALARKAEEQAIEEAEAAYWADFGRLLACEQMIDEYKPKRGENEVDMRYACALRLLPELRYHYDLALDALQALKERRGGNAGYTAAQAPGGRDF